MNSRHLYLHGFASGPSSSKANCFRDRFRALGHDLEIPNLVPGDFSEMTITGELDILASLLESHTGNNPVTLIGSSLGGYVASLFTAAQPHRIARLVLLAPAFGFPTRWIECYDPVEHENWRMTGMTTVHNYESNREEQLGYRIITDAALYPDYPRLPAEIPLHIHHGTRDESVPLEHSHIFLEQNPHAKLTEHDADHSLEEVLDPLWSEIASFLELS